MLIFYFTLSFKYQAQEFSQRARHAARKRLAKAGRMRTEAKCHRNAQQAGEKRQRQLRGSNE